jgi:hypothetical protein
MHTKKDGDRTKNQEGTRKKIAKKKTTDRERVERRKRAKKMKEG